MLLRFGDERLELKGVGGDWFLAEDVLAGTDGAEGGGVVLGVGCADVDDVDVLESLLIRHDRCT